VYIVAQKGAAIKSLVTLAGKFAKSMKYLQDCGCEAESGPTKMMAGVYAQNIVNAMDRAIEQYIQSKIVDAALGQLYELIDSLVAKLHWPVPGAAVPPADALVANPAKMEAQAQVLSTLADGLDRNTDALINQIELAIS
jgi:hypothetical protein